MNPNKPTLLTTEEAELFALLLLDYIGTDGRSWRDDLVRTIQAFELNGVRLSIERSKLIENLLDKRYIYTGTTDDGDFFGLTLQGMDKLRKSRQAIKTLTERVKSMKQDPEMRREMHEAETRIGEAFAIWLLRKLSKAERITRKLFEDELSVYAGRGVDLGTDVATLVKTLFEKKYVAEVGESDHAHLSTTVGGVEFLALNEQAVNELRTQINE